MRWTLAMCWWWAAVVEALNTSGRHAFYRSGSATAGGTRRVFGGTASTGRSWGAACILLDRYYNSRCSAAVVTARWALTAAHCVSPHLAYVKYNVLRSVAPEGDVAPVLYLYRHPGFRVVQEDEGRGIDVTLLHHDVGLVRTRNNMRLSVSPPLDLLRGMRLYDAEYLRNKELKVLGFGRTEKGLGEQLFEARMVLTGCERPAWLYCMCGRSSPGQPATGVCSGDSGGPVVYRGVQVGVTSMGPVECDGGATPADTATSVFMSLYEYAPLIEATVTEADSVLRMKQISRGSDRPLPPHALLLLLVLVSLPLPAPASVRYSFQH